MSLRFKLQWLATVVLIGLAALRPQTARGEQATTSVVLARGDFAARFYSPAQEEDLRALIVFGSGDGGWSYWEERVCAHLAKERIAVVGVDLKTYAATDFSPEILRRDYQSLVNELRRRHAKSETTPVLYGGWSMGAEQAFPASAEIAGRAPGLRGLILVAPGARGRYGLRLRDRMGIAPNGPDTFALSELAPRCADLRLAVFHAGLDMLDDLSWSEHQKLDLRRWTVPRAFHDFSGAGDQFLGALDESLRWLLGEPAPAP